MISPTEFSSFVSFGGASFQLAPTSSVASGADVAAFQQGLQSHENSVLEVGDSVESRVLEGFDSLNTKHQSSLTNLQGTLTDLAQSSNPRIQDLLYAQVQIASLALHEHLATKVCDKSAEGLKTLFKHQ